MSKNLKGENTFDVIVIGSGVGGMTVASILAKLNKKKVLVLEKHFQIGGLTHEFQRGAFSWDVGLHYVGQMADGDLPRQIFDYITDGKVKWNKMPYVYERFIYPDFSFEVPSDPEDYKNKLDKLFPEEHRAIHAYFKDVTRVAAWHSMYIVEKTLPSFIAGLLRFIQTKKRKTALLTLGRYLDKNFKSGRLKALLTSQWGDHGVPPRKVAFAIHALIVHHYLLGGYFPEGGASSIAKAVCPIIEMAGGAVLAGHTVKSLIVENGTVAGGKAIYESGPDIKEVSFYGPVVISGIGVSETFENLLKEYVTPVSTDIKSVAN